ncbi:unnamed protein product [Arabis nemorensis]|uniref:Cullin N-terminal domain-containing protein n=1 Tax=Arabis nemorensis TaxID=586526 RepID=A0A565C234_9BRAS|nr:unnamed protein product [Arabis nemorensis]
MKRSISPEPFSSAKTAKHVHHSGDDGAEDPVTFLFRPFSSRPPDPNRELYLSDAWKQLKPAINIIFQDAYTSGVFYYNIVYRAVTRACLAGSGKQLIDLIKKECEPHISAAIQSLERHNDEDDPSVFLPLVEKCWLDFKKKMMLVSDLSMYDTCGGPQFLEIGKRIFQAKLSLATQTQDKLIAGILGLVTDQRLGKTSTNVSLLKNLMEMFQGGSDVFVKPFLDSTSEFYAAKAEQVLQQSDISHYLEFVETSLREEEERKYCYCFSLICWRELIGVVARELLEVKRPLLEKVAPLAFTVFMDEGRMDDLKKMHRVLSKAGLVGGFMDRILSSYIREKGAKEGSSLLKELHTSIDKIWHKCFHGDYGLLKSIRDSFKDLGLGLHVPV